MAPIHKEGSKGEAKNYIPVALISHVIKIFEKFVRKKIIEYLQKNWKTERFPTWLQRQDHGGPAKFPKGLR